MSKSSTHNISLTELRSIIREAILSEKIGGEKIKGWKPPWASSIEGEGDWATTNRWEGSDKDEMFDRLGGYEREIAGERGASYGPDHGDGDDYDDDDDDDGDD
tara:strand:- start:254 stop:562 length:309 start_codon:yes stop_codon:yes gene_type:complete